MEAKQRFPPARQSVSTSRNIVIFQKLDLLVSTNRTKISRWKNIVSTKQKVGLHKNGELV